MFRNSQKGGIIRFQTHFQRVCENDSDQTIASKVSRYGDRQRRGNFERPFQTMLTIEEKDKKRTRRVHNENDQI